MNIKLKKTDIEYAISIIAGAIDKRKINDYCNSIYLSAVNGWLELHATDLEIFGSIIIQAQINTSGSAVLPAEPFIQAVKCAGGKEISIVSDENLRTIIDGTVASYEIAGLDPECYPLGSTNGVQDMFALPPARMQLCICSVMHAMCGDATKPQLCGINMRITDAGLLTAATTDGHRLSLATLEIPGEFITQKFTALELVIPGKTASMLSKITKTINVGRVNNSSRLHFTTGSTQISCAEIVQAYPDYRRIIPSGDGHVITVDTAALVSALESACIMSDDQFRSVVINICGEKMNITALGTINTARAAIPCLSDCDITFRLNSKYLLQALKSLGGNEVYIKYFDDKSPLLLIPSDYGHWTERMELIMPVKLP